MELRQLIVTAAAVLTGLASAHAAQQAAPVPDIGQAMLDAAYETGDANDIEAVAAAVKRVFPDYSDAIDSQTAERLAALEPAPADDADGGDGPQNLERGLFALEPWEGEVKLGANRATGNSDNIAVGFGLEASRPTGDFVHNIRAFADLARQNDETTQKRWGAAYKLDYQLSDRTYAFTRFSYEEDEFSGFDYRLFAGAGLGHFIYDTENLSWSVEGGPGYRYSPIDDTREIEQQFALYGSTEFDWTIREGVVFEQDVNVTWTQATSTLQSITALRTNITEALATLLSYEYRFETDPPEDRARIDTIARVSIVYGF